MTRPRLRIGPVIQNAEGVQKRIERELPSHPGLFNLAGGVVSSARDAERVAKDLRRVFGVHRLPAAFLGLALLLLAAWIYIQFFHTTTLRIAVADRDFQALKSQISNDKRLQFREETVSGSGEAVSTIMEKKYDLGFVQGGIEIPSVLPRLETPYPEVILWFVRPENHELSRVRKVLTSVNGSGSHVVAQSFIKAWKLENQVQYVHEWKRLTDEAGYAVPDDVDAVFVVKDPADPKTLDAVERLAQSGFLLAPIDIGVRATRLDYLTPHSVPAGFLNSVPLIPNESVATYQVKTYLVAREDMTPVMLARASHLLDGQTRSMTAGQYEPNLDSASELFQGVDAFLGIIINLILAFLALTGLEMMAYRKRFHELNSLISLISVHQSSKDVLGVTDPAVRRDHLLYLSLCSDLLGLVSMIGGYYSQENSSLLFSGLPEIIHQRCDGLKINIQLKILHATIDPKVVTVPIVDGNTSVSRISADDPSKPSATLF